MELQFFSCQRLNKHQCTEMRNGCAGLSPSLLLSNTPAKPRLSSWPQTAPFMDNTAQNDSAEQRGFATLRIIKAQLEKALSILT